MMNHEICFEEAGEPSLSVVKFATGPAESVKEGRWEELFRDARSNEFLMNQEREGHLLSTDALHVDPLETIRLALTSAIELDRVAEIAEFAISYAAWSERRTGTPLAAIRANNPKQATRLADSYGPERSVLWHLLVAWEAADTGDLGGARELLRYLVNLELPRLTGKSGDRAAFLLRYAAKVDRHAFTEIQRRLLDDNSRIELCQLLVDAGELAIAAEVARGIKIWPYQRVKQLSMVAKAQALKKDYLTARATLALAVTDVPLVDTATGWAGALTQLATAQALVGDRTEALATFRRASAMAETDAELASIASEQARVGLFDPARDTIENLTARIAGPYRTQALEALAVALAGDGRFEEALAALEDMNEFEPEYRRGVREVAAHLVTDGDLNRALELVRQLPAEHAPAGIACVAESLAQSDQSSAGVEIAQGITDPNWRARALVDIANDSHASKDVTELALAAINDVSDPENRGYLLQQLALTELPPNRSRLYQQAHDVANTLQDNESRWRLLAEIALSQRRAHVPGAYAMFAEARRTILEDIQDDSWDGDAWESRELWLLGTVQAGAGDAPGARDTFDSVLGPEGSVFVEKARVLRLMTLAGVATVQSEAGDTQGAQQTLRWAVEIGQHLHGEAQFAQQAIVEAQAELGNLHELPQAALTYALQHGEWDVALSVCQKLIDTGRSDQARQVLSALTANLDRIAGYLTGPEVISTAASLQARVGDFNGAVNTAALDPTGQASGDTSVTIAEIQIKQGDLGGALRTARQIQGGPQAAEALRIIGEEVAKQENDTESSSIFHEAAEVANSLHPRDSSVRALIETAYAEERAGHREWGQPTLVRAVAAAHDIEEPDNRGQALSLIAQAQCLLRDAPAAFSTASDITHPWFSEEALFWATLAYAQSGDLKAAVATADKIKGPWWDAAVHAAIAAMKTARGDSDAAEYEANTHKLLLAIPQGQPRTQLWDVVIAAALACGAWDATLAAAEAATKVSADGGFRLAHIANELVDRGATDTFKKAIPYCARHLESAHSLCAALARVYPQHAAAIAQELHNSSHLFDR
jgi:hypothetical protein